MAVLIPPSNFFRIMPGYMGRRTPSAWHVLVRVSKEDIDEKKQEMLGWPDVINTYVAACGTYSDDLHTEHEFRPVNDVPYKSICKRCWPYVTQKK